MLKISRAEAPLAVIWELSRALRWLQMRFSGSVQCLKHFVPPFCTLLHTLLPCSALTAIRWKGASLLYTPAPDQIISLAWLLPPPFPIYKCIFPLNSATFSQQWWGNESDNDGLELLPPPVTIVLIIFSTFSRTLAPGRVLNVPGPQNRRVQDKNVGCTMPCQILNASLLRHLLLLKPMTLGEGRETTCKRWRLT